jgi:hypothetical protein
MNAFEIIQVLTKGIVPVDRCGTSKFETSDLSELSKLFGNHYSWSGHMFKGNVFYVFNTFNDDWSIEDADIVGIALDDEHVNVFVFQVKEN